MEEDMEIDGESVVADIRDGAENVSSVQQRALPKGPRRCSKSLSVKRLNRKLSDVTKQEMAFKMKRKRTPSKVKRSTTDGRLHVTVKDSESQCNLFHAANYSKGIQVTPDTEVKSVSTVHFTNCFPERKDASVQFDGDTNDETAVTDLKIEIMDEDFLKPFLQKLEENDQLEDFRILTIAIKMDFLSVDNIAWLCALERAKYATRSSTTQMKYRAETLEFWNNIYLLFGNSALTVFRGPGNFAQVVTKQCKRGHYDPQEGKCNFSVPSVTTLKKIQTGFERKIPPGFIEQTLKMGEDMSAKGKQFTLSFDGKKIGEGLKDLSEGDVNMLGLERPKLKVTVEMFKQQLEFAEKLCKMEEIGDLSVHRVKLQRCIAKVSRVVHNLQKNIVSKVLTQNKLKKLSMANPDEKRFKFAISQINVKKHECENNLKRALKLIDGLVELSAKCEGLEHCLVSSRSLNLAECPLAFALLPPENLGNIIVLKEVSDYIKQRTPLWFNMRQLARLTGSTMYGALGLDKFCIQIDHYDTMLKGLPLVFPEDVQKKMEYGTRGIATLISKVMVAFFPQCAIYIEKGMKFLGTEEQPHMMEVSADGAIMCSHGNQNCVHGEKHIGQGEVIIEVKCRYPSKDFPHHPHDKFPVRYVTQCLAEMAAYGAKTLLLLSWTPQSTAVYLVQFCEVLWNELFALASELYGGTKCMKPSKRHPTSKRLTEELRKFVERNVRLMCIVPSSLGEDGENSVHAGDRLYYGNSPLIASQPVVTDILQHTNACGKEAKEVFTQCFNSLREPAQEVLVWMLNCKDRLQEKNMPNSAPVCYHMKGREFSMETARQLREMVRNKLHARKINVLCESYDGQFHPLIVRGKDDIPLTRIQLLRQSWKKAASLNKEKLLSIMCSATSVRKEDLNVLRNSEILSIGRHIFGNLIVSVTSDVRKLHLSSAGGAQFPEGVVSQFHFAPNANEEIPVDDIDLPRKRKKNQLKGLQEDEINIIASLHPELLDDIDVEEVIPHDVHLAEDELPDLTDNPGHLQQILNNDKFNLLHDIMIALRDHNEKKWRRKTVQELYPSILADAERLYKECVIAELKVISKVLQRYTKNRCWYDHKQNKTYNVNLISSAFESRNVLVEVRTERKVLNPPTLVNLCKSAINEKSYTATSLRVSYANVVHKYAKLKWMERATVNMRVPVPESDDEYELFSYPEKSSERQQIECRTFDPVHVLTKVRGHLCRHGYTFAKKEAFHRIANEHPHILSKSIVVDHIDPQSAFIAERVIGLPVENKCREMGYIETANFLKLFRNWFSAMNSRGRSADSRCRAMIDMDRFLLQDVNLDKFPVVDGMQYIHGMPVKTYESILQMNSTRLSLYDLAKDKTFNVRSCTSLPCESFFSDLTRCDREGHLYPKAPNISRLIARCVTLNYAKHNPSKVYELCTSNKSAYPVHLALEDVNRMETEDEDNFQGTYRNHYFDYQDLHPSHRVRREEVSTGISSLRCVAGVRQWFRTDESKIDPSHRTVFRMDTGN